jgi:hypothetical protein
MRKQPTFRQSDVTRAVKGMLAAGVEVQQAEIDQSGRIVVVAKEPRATTKPDAGTSNPWDEVLNGHH